MSSRPGCGHNAVMDHELDPRFSDPVATAVPWEDAQRVLTDPPTLGRLAAAWAEKWDGRWTYVVVEDGFAHGAVDRADDGAVDEVGDHGPVHVYAVRAAKTLAFGKEPFSQTRYS